MLSVCLPTEFHTCAGPAVLLDLLYRHTGNENQHNKVEVEACESHTCFVLGTSCKLVIPWYFDSCWNFKIPLVILSGLKELPDHDLPVNWWCTCTSLVTVLPVVYTMLSTVLVLHDIIQADNLLLCHFCHFVITGFDHP